MTSSTLRVLTSPIGPIRIEVLDGRVRHVGIADGTEPATPTPAEHSGDAAVASVAVEQVQEYLDRRRTRFDLPLDLPGTPFQRSVWEVLQGIPYGETISYGELARRVGNPAAQRAVGGANRSNPIAIVVPCHRVIGADGGLGGYAFGVERKRWLLDLEQG
ncbi:MAG: methylated-DNA--[protein]-cysteine S-methyltransferase [Myxococcales bacterium]|nr:methylated-DNA--[protein]-cysteine S-methyltransferase [Myxococcales bacterium]